MTESPVCGVVSKGGSSKAPPLLFSPYRLPTNAFPALFDAGKSEASRSLVMRYVPNGLEKTRVGVIAAKRTFRRAVDRTRARRLMREAFRLEREQLATGYDLVLIGRQKLTELQCQDVRSELLKLCRRAKLLANSTSGAKRKGE